MDLETGRFAISPSQRMNVDGTVPNSPLVDGTEVSSLNRRGDPRVVENNLIDLTGTSPSNTGGFSITKNGNNLTVNFKSGVVNGKYNQGAVTREGTRELPAEYRNNLVNRLKEAYPDHNIIRGDQ